MSKSQRTLRALAESAIMLALATALSLIPIVELPYGGSITVASMLPVLIIAYRYGVKWGFLMGAAHGGVQLLLGLKNVTYFTTWYSILAVILLDYIVAFMCIGFGGSFRGKSSQPAGLVMGGLLVCVLRYLCHVISGATVWAGLSIPTQAALAYSFIYNATYMVPETIVLLIAAYTMGSKLDFRGTELKAYTAEDGRKPSALDWAGALLAAGALIFSTVMIFSRLQNAETGEFDVTGIASANWMLISTVTGAALVGAIILIAVSRAKKGKPKE